MLKAMLRKREEGFTLVELMIVVAIIGVLAALAIYGVSRYLKHSKTAEATRNLGAMETGSKNAFQQETDTSGSGTGPFVHKFCNSSTISPPSTGLPAAAKIKAPSTDWNDAAWTCLKFSINEPQFYQYTYTTNSSTGTAATYAATANGDLDGNGTKSTFQLNGQGSSTGDATRLSMVITNEDE
jgi:type IV pilus assembly protein PilA